MLLSLRCRLPAAGLVDSACVGVALLSWLSSVELAAAAAAVAIKSGVARVAGDEIEVGVSATRQAEGEAASGCFEAACQAGSGV